MLPEFSRSALLLGVEGMTHLSQAHVAVFGVGGVGSYTVEALARAGVGALTLFDGDTVSVTNRNRQLVALASTVGRSKVEVMAERVRDINPACKVTAIDLFYTPETAIDFTQFTYVADAIDTVTAKLDIIEKCTRLGVPIISSMGTGNKLDPTRFTVTDIYKTEGCPLARVLRKECKARGIPHLKVVYSTEPAQSIPPERRAMVEGDKKGTADRPVPASLSFVPPVAGMILAGQIIREIAEV